MIVSKILSLTGLGFDIIGFILISLSIIKRPKIKDMNRSLNRGGGFVYNEKPLFESKRAKVGFLFVVIGFFFQFLGTLLNGI